MSVFIKKQHTDCSNNCLICFENLSIKNNSLNKFCLECNQCHKQFHIECIKSWNKYRNHCPHCRYSIEEEIDFYYEEIDFYYHAFPSDQFIIYYPIYLAVYSLLYLLCIFVFIIILIYYYLF